MAIVKYGHLIAEARGKLNGTVFSRNTYGAYMRTKVTPANPSTAFQAAVRADMTTHAQAWRALTAAQRVAWSALAIQLTRINIFGDNVPLTGFNAFIKINRNLGAAGTAPLTDAPVLGSVTALTALTVAAAAGASTVGVTFAPTPVPAGYALVIRATPQMSAGINFVKSEYRQLSIVAAAGASPSAQGAAYETRFGNLVAANKLFVSARLINLTSGLYSGEFSAEAIVAA